MKNYKENFNETFFKWFNNFFFNKPTTLKIKFKNDLYNSVFPTLTKVQANSRFENYRREKATKINYLTAKEFVNVIKKYDDTFEIDLFKTFNIKQDETK